MNIFTKFPWRIVRTGYVVDSTDRIDELTKRARVIADQNAELARLTRAMGWQKNVIATQARDIREYQAQATEQMSRMENLTETVRSHIDGGETWTTALRGYKIQLDRPSGQEWPSRAELNARFALLLAQASHPSTTAPRSVELDQTHPSFWDRKVLGTPPTFRGTSDGADLGKTHAQQVGRLENKT